MGSSSYPEISVWDESGSNYVMVKYQTVSQNFFFIVQDGVDSDNKDSGRQWDADVWYWVEIYVQQDAIPSRTIQFRVDGTVEWTFATNGDWGNFATVKVGKGITGGGHVFLDYLRATDGYEFPPVNVVQFNVIPEIPFGTIGVAAAMVIALGLFAIKKKKRKN